MAIKFFKGTNVIFALVVLLILGLLFWPTKPAKGPVKTAAPKAATDTMPAVPPLLAQRYKDISGAVDAARIKSDIDVLASYPSRMVGYPGCEQAAQYVEQQFRKIGLQDVEAEIVEDLQLVEPVTDVAGISVAENKGSPGIFARHPPCEDPDLVGRFQFHLVVLQLDRLRRFLDFLGRKKEDRVFDIFCNIRQILSKTGRCRAGEDGQQ